MDDDAAERELRELRARAYGRDADIALDAAAARRLHELEWARSAARARRAAPEVPPTPVEVSHAPLAPAPLTPPSARSVPTPADSEPASAVRESDAVDGLRVFEPDDDEEAADPERESERIRERATRRRITWWAASVVASAAVAAVVTFTLTSSPPVSASSGAPQVETLRLTGAADRIPEGWFGAGGDTIAADFSGFTVFAISNWGDARSDDGGQPNCIGVVRTDQIPPVDGFDPNDWGYGGDFYSSCDIGVFPATVQLPISGSAPDELLERYPSAEALQFVLDGDRVGVFLDSGLG